MIRGSAQLLLDETTRALNTENERQVVKMLDNASDGKIITGNRRGLLTIREELFQSQAEQIVSCTLIAYSQVFGQSFFLMASSTWIASPHPPVRPSPPSFPYFQSGYASWMYLLAHVRPGSEALQEP